MKQKNFLVLKYVFIRHLDRQEDLLKCRSSCFLLKLKVTQEAVLRFYFSL